MYAADANQSHKLYYNKDDAAIIPIVDGSSVYKYHRQSIKTIKQDIRINGDEFDITPFIADYFLFSLSEFL